MLKHRCHDGLRREALQIRKAFLDNFGVGRKDAGEHIALEHDEREHHADGLRRDRRDSSARGVHAEDRDQKEVARDVDDAGHQHEDERRAAVAKPAEDGGEQVIGNDEENAAAADAHIARCEVNGLLGRLHQHGNGPRKAHEQNEYPDGQDREHDRRAAEDRTDLLWPLFAKIPRDESRDSHRELRDHEGHKVQDLAAGRNCGESCRRAELADDQQVDRAVGRLQNERAEHGEHEKR